MDAAELTHEEEYLANTVRFIDHEIANIDLHRPSHAATTYAANALERNKDAIIDGYARARPQPYFGRVDFHGEDGQATEGYIGKTFIPGHVYSWTAPYAKHLFFADPSAGLCGTGRVYPRKNHAEAAVRDLGRPAAGRHGNLPCEASRCARPTGSCRR